MEINVSTVELVLKILISDYKTVREEDVLIEFLYSILRLSCLSGSNNKTCYDVSVNAFTKFVGLLLMRTMELLHPNTKLKSDCHCLF